MIDKTKCLFYIEMSKDNIDGGIVPLRDELISLQKTNDPFIKKHNEYSEVHEFTIGEVKATLVYYIYNHKMYGPTKD